MHKLRYVAVATALLCAFSVTPSARSQDEDGLLPGLVTTFTDGTANSIQRIDLHPSFAWKNAAPDNRLNEQDIHFLSSGLLEVLVKGEYRFAIRSIGKATLSIDDSEVVTHVSRDIEWTFSEPIELSFGLKKIDIRYESLGRTGDLRIFWQGKNFRWEPLPSQYLYHESHNDSIDLFAEGRMLTHVLKCGACHLPKANSNFIPPKLAPDLTKLAGNIRKEWLTQWIMDHGKGSDVLDGEKNTDAEKEDSASSKNISDSQVPARTMPHYALNKDYADVLTTYLLHSANDAEDTKDTDDKTKESVEASLKYTLEEAKAGEKLFLTKGCIACHQHLEGGNANAFDGGDLRNIADKRPADFFERWLSDPASLNKNHRMPIFTLSESESRSLGAFLANSKSLDTRNAEREEESKPQQPEEPNDKTLREKLELGKNAFEKLRCTNCHEKPDPIVHFKSDKPWIFSCIEKHDNFDQPYYRLKLREKKAIRHYFDTLAGTEQLSAPSGIDPELLIAENNCFSCHSRDGSDGVKPYMRSVSRHYPELASALFPPSLNSVGDKFTEKSLVDAITKPDNDYRDWLVVQMPQFRLTEQEAKSIANEFIRRDSIPSMPKEFSPKLITDLDAKKMTFSAPSLVTSSGFSCTSCHQIGSVKPAAAPVNARGPKLSMIKDRVRHEWFNRWLHDPARIVPGMEMPSVRSPVRGYFDNDVDQQIAAVWKILNKNGFEPPIPQPIRILKRSGIESDKERAITLVDVVSDHQRIYVQPIVIGLPNRHNILFDFESGRLQRWWQGDMLNQQNRGKTWFWEPASVAICNAKGTASEFQLKHPDFEPVPVINSQFNSELDSWETSSDTVIVKHRLRFRKRESKDEVIISVTQVFTPVWKDETSRLKKTGFTRKLTFSNIPEGGEIEISLQLLPVEKPVAERAKTADELEDERLLGEIPGFDSLDFEISDKTHKFKSMIEANLRGNEEGVAANEFKYLLVERAIKRIHDEEPEEELVVTPFEDTQPDNKQESLNILPGFDAVRLPTTSRLMPTAIDWRPDGKMVVADLKGRVWLLDDLSGDGIEDRAVSVSEELATPYGLHAEQKYIDVVVKNGVVRLTDEDGDGHFETNKIVASGWGHTDDYHDWAVGLPVSPNGGYLVALPCQQDDRSDAAAKYRGKVLQLKPRTPTIENPRLFSLDVLSSGHRFPMGIAVNNADQVFVTDNQGNYNPFNELNRVRKGDFFGFINKNERKAKVEDGDGAPVEFDFGPLFRDNPQPPSINIPHPWTRSVNGICFLEIDGDEQKSKDVFGPFAGHLVGCEYDSKRLIRMSLETVSGVTQGAAYPFSLDPAESESDSNDAMIGPIECAISPKGDVYVGSMRDSGWGAGNNEGEIVRLRPQLDKLPTGIAEVRVARDAFNIYFTHPVDKALASNPKNYVVNSYTRTSTPQYGGEDEKRRVENVVEAIVADDLRSVRLKIKDLRTSFVYEFRLKSLIESGEFFPAEAYYTLLKRKYD